MQMLNVSRKYSRGKKVSDHLRVQHKIAAKEKWELIDWKNINDMIPLTVFMIFILYLLWYCSILQI